MCSMCSLPFRRQFQTLSFEFSFHFILYLALQIPALHCYKRRCLVQEILKINLEQIVAKIVPILLFVSYLSRIDILVFILHLCQVRWPHHSLSTPSMHLQGVQLSTRDPCSFSSMKASATHPRNCKRNEGTLPSVVIQIVLPHAFQHHQCF